MLVRRIKMSCVCFFVLFWVFSSVFLNMVFDDTSFRSDFVREVRVRMENGS